MTICFVSSTDNLVKTALCLFGSFVFNIGIRFFCKTWFENIEEVITDTVYCCAFHHEKSCYWETQLESSISSSFHIVKYTSATSFMISFSLFMLSWKCNNCIEILVLVYNIRCTSINKIRKDRFSFTQILLFTSLIFKEFFSLHKIKMNLSGALVLFSNLYTAQNKYVSTRLFAFFDVLNWSLI